MNKKAVCGIGLFIVIAFFALVGPYLTGHSYFDINLAIKNQPPSTQYWFGTDDLGRDMFTRVSMGARISLFVGISAATIDMFIGVVWGSAAALSTSRVDDFLMRVADILFALPYLLIVILVMVTLGPGIYSVIISMTVLGWITMARVVRGQVLQIKQMEFVLVSKSLGGGFWHILTLHILPNVKSSILATLALTVPHAIFTEAFLSFLGLGVQAPMSSWGTLANEGLPALPYYPWRLFFPAAFICLTMLSFNLINESLVDE